MADLNGLDIAQILERSFTFKAQKESGSVEKTLSEKRILSIFDEPSFRTKSAFEIAATDLGASIHSFDGRSARFTAKGDYRENMPDMAAMISGFYDVALIRVYENKLLVDLEEQLSVPLINGMCNMHHPTQALCDAFTIMYYKNQLVGPKVAFIGDFTNVARSMAHLLHAVGGELNVSCPPEIFETDCDVKNIVAYSEDAMKVARDADVIITDVWTPMNSGRTEKDMEKFIPYRVNADLCRKAKDDFIFMHNLPANRGYEVTSDIIDGENSVIYYEAIARLHIARGLLDYVLCG